MVKLDSVSFIYKYFSSYLNFLKVKYLFFFLRFFFSFFLTENTININKRCTKSCEGGNRKRNRNIVTNSTCGGDPCVGENTENEICNAQCCPGSLKDFCKFNNT